MQQFWGRRVTVRWFGKKKWTETSKDYKRRSMIWRFIKGFVTEGNFIKATANTPHEQRGATLGLRTKT